MCRHARARRRPQWYRGGSRSPGFLSGAKPKEVWDHILNSCGTDVLDPPQNEGNDAQSSPSEQQGTE